MSRGRGEPTANAQMVWGAVECTLHTLAVTAHLGALLNHLRSALSYRLR